MPCPDEPPYAVSKSSPPSSHRSFMTKPRETAPARWRAVRAKLPTVGGGKGRSDWRKQQSSETRKPKTLLQSGLGVRPAWIPTHGTGHRTQGTGHAHGKLVRGTLVNDPACQQVTTRQHATTHAGRSLPSTSNDPDTPISARDDFLYRERAHSPARRHVAPDRRPARCATERPLTRAKTHGGGSGGRPPVLALIMTAGPPLRRFPIITLPVVRIITPASAALAPPLLVALLLLPRL